MTINYSIIIPHYNYPEGLRRCLSSIPLRPDVEVIVVDDVSDNECIELLKSIEREFPNVRIVYSRVKGYGGRARNIGLELAKGQFVLFSDTDDFFTDGFSVILDEYKNSEFDITFFKTNTIDADSGKPTPIQHHLNEYIDLWRKDPKTAELYLRYMFGEPWCKLIRRQIIVEHNIRFDETRINNDTTFSYLVGHYAKTVSVDNRYLYNYEIRQGSTSRQRDIYRYYIKIDVFGRSELFFREHNIPLHEDRQYMALSGLLKKIDIKGFKMGLCQLEELGYSKKVIRKEYSKTMGHCTLPVPIWNVIFAPDLSIKVQCLYYWFKITIPERLFGCKTKELRRY